MLWLCWLVSWLLDETFQETDTTFTTTFNLLQWMIKDLENDSFFRQYKILFWFKFFLWNLHLLTLDYPLFKPSVVSCIYLYQYNTALFVHLNSQVSSLFFNVGILCNIESIQYSPVIEILHWKCVVVYFHSDVLNSVGFPEKLSTNILLPWISIFFPTFSPSFINQQ